MAFAIQTDEPIVRIDLSGTLTNDNLLGLARDMLAYEGKLSVIPHRLTDVRAVTRLEITFNDIFRLAERRLAQKFPNVFKSAIIASDVVHYGFARMFQTLNDHPQISIANFSDSPQALRWLAEPGQDVPKLAWASRQSEG